jgi:thiamine biosynthesis lipoprotein ApbE
VLGRGRWTASLADPARRTRTVAALDLAGGSLSTSGNSEHPLEVDGRRVGHLLDPRSGAPARDFGSLTVWAPTGLIADCLSTGLFVMGPDAALAWAATHPGIEVVVLEHEASRLRLRASAGLAGRVRPLVPDLVTSFEATPGGHVASRENEEAAGRSAWQRGPAAP